MMAGTETIKRASLINLKNGEYPMNANKQREQQLAARLLALSLAATERIKQWPRGKVKTNSAGHAQFNNLNTRNSYGEFTWIIQRRKGHPVVVISRSGKLYGRLQMTPGTGYRQMQQYIVDFLNDRLCSEV